MFSSITALVQSAGCAADLLRLQWNLPAGWQIHETPLLMHLPYIWCRKPCISALTANLVLQAECDQVQIALCSLTRKS